MATYELILLIDSDLPEDSRDGMVGAARKTIEQNAGQITGDETWGVRKLAYEIDHRTEASYHVFRFEGGSDLVNELNRTLGITDGLLRHRVVRRSSRTPDAGSPDGARRGKGDPAVAARPGEAVAESETPDAESATPTAGS